MSIKSADNYEVLRLTLRQHEEIITQLVQMNAATNRKVLELTKKEDHKRKAHTFT